LYPAKQQEIQASYDAEDWQSYAIKVHSLKSTSLSIGGQKLSELAKQLEKAGKEKEVEFIRKHHGAVMKLYEDTVRECHNILSGEIRVD